MYRLAFGLQPKKVLLPAPAFVEYEEAHTAAGAQIEYYRMTEDFIIKEDILEHITEDTDFVLSVIRIIPTGILTERERISEFLIGQKKTKTFVLVDECFLEICKMKKNIQ